MFTLILFCELRQRLLDPCQIAEKCIGLPLLKLSVTYSPFQCLEKKNKYMPICVKYQWWIHLLKIL